MGFAQRYLLQWAALISAVLFAWHSMRGSMAWTIIALLLDRRVDIKMEPVYHLRGILDRQQYHIRRLEEHIERERILETLRRTRNG